MPTQTATNRTQNLEVQSTGHVVEEDQHVKFDGGYVTQKVSPSAQTNDIVLRPMQPESHSQPSPSINSPTVADTRTSLPTADTLTQQQPTLAISTTQTAMPSPPLESPSECLSLVDGQAVTSCSTPVNLQQSTPEGNSPSIATYI
jgi:hypothetical protein